MIGRRHALALLLAAPLAPGAALARDIGEREALAEFRKILATFNASDIAGFLAYGPPQLKVGDAVIPREQLPAFFESFTHHAGKPDEKPAWVEGPLIPGTGDPGDTVYQVRVLRSVWFEAWSEWVGDDTLIDREIRYPAGYDMRYERWNLVFRDGRIVWLHRVMAVSYNSSPDNS